MSISAPYSLPFASAFAFGLRLLLLFFTAVLCLTCPSAFAQAAPASGDYTNSLPSVQRVQAEIKGSEPTDTLARQMAVFDYLDQYIETIKYNRVGPRGSYTPGEQKLYDAYRLASYQISQDYAKSHTPAEATAFGRLHMQYFLSGDFYKDWYPRLVGQQATDTYKGAKAGLAQSYQRNQDRIQQGLNHPQGAGSTDDPMAMFAPADQDVENDPKLRRCLELGGTVDECGGSGLREMGKMAEALARMAIGENANPAEPRNGVVLVGSYHSRGDLPELALTSDGKALLQKCGTLVDDNHTYMLRKSGAATQIVVENEPNPIVLTLRPEGSLSGPGNIAVKGNIISGYHNQYNCPAGTSHFNCTTSSTPIYSPSMQRCTISQLAPRPAPPPKSKPTGLIGQFSTMLGADPVAPIYGFRVIGPYTSTTGMQLSFDNRYVTLDCGQAHVNAPYAIDNTAGGFIIHVQNGGGAFLLAVGPDNTLRGSGSTSVNGRLLTAIRGDDVSFTPHSESCNVGTFVPKGQQNGPMPAMPAAYSSLTAAPASSSVAATKTIATPTAPSGTRAQFRVLLSSNFTGANPLVGHAVFVTRKPMDQILRELGVAVPARATPGQAMQALQTQCHSAQGCSAIIQGMSKYYVTITKLDASGKATLSATARTGPYYFFAIVPASGGSLMWDIPANLTSGDNAVAFDQANAERLR
jgi:hypothetical protein